MFPEIVWLANIIAKYTKHLQVYSRKHQARASAEIPSPELLTHSTRIFNTHTYYKLKSPNIYSMKGQGYFRYLSAILVNFLRRKRRLKFKMFFLRKVSSDIILGWVHLSRVKYFTRSCITYVPIQYKTVLLSPCRKWFLLPII